ncbi:MAG: glycosyltransferase family 4 protein [Kiritimatiellia bacterium]
MNDSLEVPCRIAVAQLGARRHYAVPLAFEHEGVLEHFYTDFFLKGRLLSGLASTLSRILPWGGMQRLSGRRCPELPARKTTSFWNMGLGEKLYPGKSHLEASWVRSGEAFCRSILACGLGNADAVYAFSSAAKELLLYCREQGLTGILDHATAPQKAEMKLVREEQERFPAWGRAETESPALEKYCQRQRDEVELASVVLCGSSFVKKMLMDEGVVGSKIRVVPLGVSLPPELSRVPHNGMHVLFVGGEGLRKGIGYLVRAAEILKAADIQFRAVGDLGLTPEGWSSVRRFMEAPGPVPRSAMREHWAWADVLVLSSVSETFGLVILEAMAAGIAVITTTSTCGPDVMREGVDGYVISPRDAETLAAKLYYLAANPAHLAEMKIRARERAADFTLEQYGRRLVNALRGDSGA